jgi:hypothetical protein
MNSMHSTARIHCRTRRRGGMAARGKSATGDRVRRIGVLMVGDEKRSRAQD